MKKSILGLPLTLACLGFTTTSMALTLGIGSPGQPVVGSGSSSSSSSSSSGGPTLLGSGPGQPVVGSSGGSGSSSSSSSSGSGLLGSGPGQPVVGSSGGTGSSSSSSSSGTTTSTSSSGGTVTSSSGGLTTTSSSSSSSAGSTVTSSSGGGSIISSSSGGSTSSSSSGGITLPGNPGQPVVSPSNGPSVGQWMAQYNAAALTTPFRIPADMQVTAPLSPGELVTAKYSPFIGRMRAQNNAFGVLGEMLASIRPTSPRTPTANTSPMDPWEWDGYAISSCDEFVYKKYYDYRRFQDAAATCAGNPDCIYDLWVSSSVPGENLTMAPKSGVETIIGDYPNSPLDPLPGHLNQAGGTTQQLKNPFRDPSAIASFVAALVWAETAPNPTNVSRYLPVHDYLTSAAFTPGSPSYDSPYYTITGSRMPWHIQMHDQQATYGENMLDRVEIAKRTATMESLLSAYNNAFAYDMDQVYAWEKRVIAACGSLVQVCPPDYPQCNPTGAQPSPACVAVKNQNPGMPTTYPAATALADALADEFFNVDRVTGTLDYGCLGTGHNKCDWSPSMIMAEYLTPIDASVASDLAMCDSVVNTEPVTVVNDALPGATSDEYYFEQGLYAVVQKGQTARQALSWAQSAPDTIHYDLFGAPVSWSIGGSVAGASYQQSAWWEVHGTKSNGVLCKTSGRVQGSASAQGSVFGQQFTILDADINLGVGERYSDASDLAGYDAEAHLAIMKPDGSMDEVYQLPATGDVGGAGPFNEPFLGKSYSDTVLDIPGQISWVSLDLKVNLGANVDATFSGTVPSDCTQVTDPTQAAYALSVDVEPSVSATAVGTALVGALGTGVGIQGKLDVLKATLPVKVGTAIGPDSSGNVALNLSENASLNLTVLSGELDTAECLLGDCATQELYKWNGIPAFNSTLWNKTWSFPVIAMQQAFE